MMLWLCALAGASGPLDVEAAEAFVGFYCSGDNVARLPSGRTLLPLPDGIAADRVRPAIVRHLLVVEADGTLVVPNSERPDQWDAIWVHPDLDSKAASLVFADLAGRRKGPLPFVFERLDVDPRPAEPLRGVDDEIRRLRPMRPAQRDEQVTGRCDVHAKMKMQGCAAYAERVLRTIHKRRCATEAIMVLARFASFYDRGAPGVPVVVVDVSVSEATEQAGTWGTVHAELLRDPSAEPDKGAAEASRAPPGVWRELDPAEVSVRRRVEPSVSRPGLARCLVRVFVDERGVPAHVEVTGCAAEWRDAAGAALVQWRWSPHREEARPVRFQTVVVVHFR